jgi:CII-binding regulator of phage lambda lysogenization HflD
LKGNEHKNSKNVLKAVLTILIEIQRSDFIVVYGDWIERLKEIIETEGEYITR